jgi:hypothetical protein
VEALSFPLKNDMDDILHETSIKGVANHLDPGAETNFSGKAST